MNYISLSKLNAVDNIITIWIDDECNLHSYNVIAHKDGNDIMLVDVDESDLVISYKEFLHNVTEESIELALFCDVEEAQHWCDAINKVNEI